MNRILATALFITALCLTAAGTVACGPTAQAGCGPGTCKGCCTADGVCDIGNLTSSCGAAGAQCAACPSAASGQFCNNGFCVFPEQCAGCTDSSGACLSGLSSDACGGGGVACDVCASDESCANRTCQRICKDENAECLSGSECCSGRCGIFGLCAAAIPDGGPEEDGGTDGGEVDGGELDGGEDAGTCGDVCVASSTPIDAACDPCAEQVCMFSPSCCTTAWDATCVSFASILCGSTCGGGSGGFDAGFPSFDGGFPSFDGGFPDGGP